MIEGAANEKWDKGEVCRTCMYWEKHAIRGTWEKDGACKFLPPQVISRSFGRFSSDVMQSEFPATWQGDWCGQWRKK